MAAAAMEREKGSLVGRSQSDAGLNNCSGGEERGGEKKKKIMETDGLHLPTIFTLSSRRLTVSLK